MPTRYLLTFLRLEVLLLEHLPLAVGHQLRNHGRVALGLMLIEAGPQNRGMVAVDVSANDGPNKIRKNFRFVLVNYISRTGWLLPTYLRSYHASRLRSAFLYSVQTRLVCATTAGADIARSEPVN